MKRDKFLELFSRKLRGELSVKENELLSHAIASREEYTLLALKLEQYFIEKETFKPHNAQLDQIWESISTAETLGFKERFDYADQRKTPLLFPLLKIAAIVVVITGISLLGYHLLYRSTDQHYDQITTTKEQTFKLLDDGTKIWLNKKSSISYNKAFGKQKREIRLAGEAYFDVAKNAAVPLFIHVGKLDIEVKGTAFNVKAYRKDPEIQVALLRGSIKVTDRLNTTNQVLLQPNEKLFFAQDNSGKAQHTFKVLPLAVHAMLKDTEWITDTLIFKKQKLKDLAVRMERKYDMRISIESDLLKEKRFSGTFTNETIQQALAALKLSYPLTYTINNKMVIIKD